MPGVDKSQQKLISEPNSLRLAKLPAVATPAKKTQLDPGLETIKNSNHSSTQFDANGPNGFKVARFSIQYKGVNSQLKFIFIKDDFVKIDLSPNDSKNPGRNPDRYVTLTLDIKAKRLEGFTGAFDGKKLSPTDAKKSLDKLIQAALKQISTPDSGSNKQDTSPPVNPLEAIITGINKFNPLKLIQRK